MRRELVIVALTVAGSTLGSLAVLDWADFQGFLWSLLFR